MRTRLMPFAALLIALLLLVPGCLAGDFGPVGPGDPGGEQGARDPELPEADLRVLFLGNSLTYTNDLPGVVDRLAEAAGLSYAGATLAQPNWSLQEHWSAGVAGVIERLAPDVVVLQQGPSSLPASQVHLAEWSGRIADVVENIGGEVALLMVWPEASRMGAFPHVRDSYESAARSVGGRFIPAGETWLRVWDRDPALALYGPDGFHPSYLGTLAAARTVAAVLFGVAPEDMPALEDGVSPATLAVLDEAVAEAVSIAFQPALPSADAAADEAADGIAPARSR